MVNWNTTTTTTTTTRSSLGYVGFAADKKGELTPTGRGTAPSSSSSLQATVRGRLLPQSPPAQKGRGKIRRVERPPPPPPPLWEVRSSSGLALFHVTTTTTQLLLLLLLLRQSRARFRHRNMWVVWKEEGKKGIACIQEHLSEKKKKKREEFT